MLRLYQTPSYELRWDPNKGTVCLQSPGRSIELLFVVEYLNHGKLRQLTSDMLVSGRISQETISDVNGLGENIQIQYVEAQGLATSLQIRLYQTRPFILLRMSMTNVGRETVNIQRFFIRSQPGGLKSISPPRGFFSNRSRYIVPSGYLDRNEQPSAAGLVQTLTQNLRHNGHVYNHIDGRGLFVSEMVGAVVSSNEALIAGGVTTADQFVRLLADLKGDDYYIILQSSADGIPLEVGSALSSEWFYLEWVPLPNFEPFAQYAHALMRHMDVGRVKDFPFTLRTRDSEQHLIAERDIIEHMTSAVLFSSELPLKSIEVNQGYEALDGDWTARDEYRFPHDLAWIAQRIQGSGYLPSLTLSPLLVTAGSEITRLHKDWLLVNERDKPVTIKFPNHTSLCLDITHPDVFDYLTDLFHAVVGNWGYRALHLTYMFAGALLGKRYNPRMTRAQALRRLYHCIRDSVGNDVHISTSQSQFGPAVGLVDALQIGLPSTSSWGTGKGNFSRMKTAKIIPPGMSEALLNTLNYSWINNRLWKNDPGPLRLDIADTALTKVEIITQITLMGLSGSAISIADNLTNIHPDYRSLFAVLLPPFLKGIDAVNIFEPRKPDVVSTEIAKAWGHWYLVGLFNWSDDDVERDLPASLRLDKQADYHLVDFWEQRYFRMKQENPWPVIHIDAHGVVLLALRKVLVDRPHIVGTTFHISQGAEISEYQQSQSSITVSVNLGRDAKGSIWFALPAKPTSVKVNDIELGAKAVRTVAIGVYAVNFTLREKAELTVSWSEDTSQTKSE